MPAPLPVASEPSRLAVLLALRDIAAHAAAIDTVAADDDHGAIAPAATELCELIEHTLELLGALQLVDDDDTAFADLDRLERRLDQRAAIRLPDVCATATTELKRALRELLAAVGDDDRVIAIDNGLRKLRRAVGAVLDVRQLYAQLRRALPRPEGDDPEVVMAAVRLAGNALAAVSAYAELRAADRRALRRLRERTVLWTRHDRSAPSGLLLLDDLRALGDALRAISRRDLVAVHDSALISVLSRGAVDPAAWFAQLDALFGLDDALDNVLERARRTSDQSAGDVLIPLVPLARAALARLAQVI